MLKYPVELWKKNFLGLVIFIKTFVAKTSSSATWKTIEQPKLKRGVTPQAKVKRIKQFLKGLLLILSLVMVMVGAWVGFQGYQFMVQWMSKVGPSQPLSHIVFESDGVLSKSWLEKKLLLPWGTPLLSIDIHEIKNKLEDNPQIQSVVVERLFPSTLNIRLRELQPIARIAVRESSLRSSIYLVATDGQVYRGEGYAASLLDPLPFFEGIKLRKDPAGGFLPLEGFEALYDLLTQARMYYPDVYHSWKSIVCDRFKGNPEVLGAAFEVKTKDGAIIVFSPQKPLDQLQRLEYILNYVAQNGKPTPRRIDLTLDDQAAVEFQKPSKNIPSRRLK